MQRWSFSGVKSGAITAFMTNKKKSVKKYDAKAHNKKISQKRSDAWKASAVQGRFDAANNPTLLRVLRVGLGKPQDWLADKLKVPLSSYGTIERGKRKVDEAKALIIAKALSKSVAVLFVKEKGGFKAALSSGK